MKPEQPKINQTSTQQLVSSKATHLDELTTWDHPESNWNQAISSTPQVDPYCCRTEWQLSYHEAMEPDRDLLVREVPGSLIAFADVERPDGGRLFLPVEAHWFFGCPLLGPDAINLLEEMIVVQELKPGIPPPLFVISGVEPDGELLQNLSSQLRPLVNGKQHEINTLCSASLEGGLDGFLSRRSAKHRRNLGKQARRAARAGVTFERYNPTNAEEAQHLYMRMLAVEEESWKGIDQCGMTVGDSRTYYEYMMRRLSVSASSRVILARYEERDIGYIFGALFDGIYRGQQFSFADDWKSFSIGNLLQLEQITWLCEENVVRYDMGPMMEYKKHWTEQRRLISTIVLQPKK